MRLLRSVLVFVLVALCFSCKKEDNIAAGGAHLFVSADPAAVGPNGTSEITVTGTDEDGAPLPDGTQVTLHVEQAGHVSPDVVQLVDGTATSTYFATLASGEITIVATSGSIQATTTIQVADDIQRNVFVSANPATFPSGGGTSLISAVVTDDSGAPIEGIGVQFTTSEGSLQSNGDFIETDSSGIANDTLNTTASATVTATTDDGFSGQTTVLVGVGQIICHFTVSTRTPAVGQVVSFLDTSDNPGNQIVRYHWDFGDDTSADGQNVQHAYDEAGTFETVHSVTDARGNTIFCDPLEINVSP